MRCRSNVRQSSNTICKIQASDLCRSPCMLTIVCVGDDMCVHFNCAQPIKEACMHSNGAYTQNAPPPPPPTPKVAAEPTALVPNKFSPLQNSMSATVPCTLAFQASTADVDMFPHTARYFAQLSNDAMGAQRAQQSFHQLRNLCARTARKTTGVRMARSSRPPRLQSHPGTPQSGGLRASVRTK